LCEVQGYAYAAYRGAAKLAAALGQDAQESDFSAQADGLHRRFNKAFWCEELSTYAMALDGEKRPCCVLASNAGHCLFAGIATPERASPIAETLLSQQCFSGWGIRTVASSESRFNPMSYHNGSVWPHDNALIAHGMANYGLSQQVNRVFKGLFDAAMYFDLHRMPELFCGFSQESGEGPVLYPVACAPHSWSAASVFLFFQACMGIQIDGLKKQVTFRRPVLPDFLTEVYIRNLCVGGGSLDLCVRGHRDEVSVTVESNRNNIAVLLVK
jgi:glycogen debranching enzyme